MYDATGLMLTHLIKLTLSPVSGHVNRVAIAYKGALVALDSTEPSN